MTRAPQIILVPFLFDLFLWLGPRLSAYPLVKGILAFMLSLPAMPDQTAQTQMAQMQTLLDQIGQQFNLFTWLSPMVLGVPSLMSNILGNAQPWAQPGSIWEVNNVLVYLGMFGLFSLIGLGLTALYWSQVARAVLKHYPGDRGWAAHTLHIWGGLVKLTMVLITLGLVIGFPALIVATIAGLINLFLGQLIIMLGLATFMWAASYMVFALHGIALRQASFFQAVKVSLILMRTQFFSAAGLLMISLLIYIGLGIVWNLPEGDSWLRAGALLGNAFIATGVLCATMMFYAGRVPEQTEDSKLKAQNG